MIIEMYTPKQQGESWEVSIPFPEDLNPCNGCPMHDLCDADECGMKLYPLDTPKRHFKNLREYINTQKLINWVLCQN